MTTTNVAAGETRPILRSSWPMAILLAGAIVIGFGLASTLIPPFVVIALVIGTMASLLGAPYGVYFVIFAVKRWSSAVDGPRNAGERELISGFASLNQRMTFILNLLLLLNLAVIGSLAFVAQFDSELATQLDRFGMSFVCGSCASAGAVAIFVLNLAWYRGRDLVGAENAAVRGKADRFRFISANRVLSLVVWCIYGIGGLLVATITIIGSLMIPVMM